MVGESEYGQEQEQEELEKILDQIESVEPAFDDLDELDRNHTFCNEKMSMAQGTRYRREREQTSL